MESLDMQAMAGFVASSMARQRKPIHSRQRSSGAAAMNGSTRQRQRKAGAAAAAAAVPRADVLADIQSIVAGVLGVSVPPDEPLMQVRSSVSPKRQHVLSVDCCCTARNLKQVHDAPSPVELVVWR